MDEVLNRKIFRHKAQIYFKNVQGYVLGRFIGAGLQYGPRLLKAGKEGIETFRALRATRDPSIFQRYVSGPIGKKVEQFAEKYPRGARATSKTYGGLETLGGGALLAEGATDIYRGVEDDNPQQIGEGVAGLLGGKTLAKFGIPRVRGKEVPQFRFLSDLGLPLGVGYGSTFLPTGDNLVKIQNKEIEDFEKSTGKKLNAEDRKIAEKIIEDSLKKSSTLPPAGSQLAKSFPGMTNTEIIEGKGRTNSVDLFNNNANEIIQQSNNSKNIPPTGISKDEILSTFENDKKKERAGQNLRKTIEEKASLGDTKALKFKDFYKRYKEETGDSDEISDLLLAKLATGLITGTTTKTGLEGFLDVAGKSGGEVIDASIQIALKEKDRKANLFEAFLKNEKANESNAITTERFTRVIPDPNAFGGIRVEQLAKFKNGLDAKAVMSDQIDPVTGLNLPVWIQAEYEPNAIEVRAEPKILDEGRSRLNSLAESYKMASLISKADKGTLGAAGSVKAFKEKILGSFSDILENEVTPSSYKGNFDEYLNDKILGQGIRMKDGTILSAADAIAQKEKLISELVKERSSSKFFGRPSKNELEKIVRNARIEVNFAYAYANSLKGDDRLTERNIDDAKQISKVLGFESGEKIITAFKQLAEEANSKFATESRRYLTSGGNSMYIKQNFAFMPYYQEEMNRIKGGEKRGEAQKNLMGKVQDLPDKYK